MIGTANASNLVSPKPGIGGIGMSMDDEGDVVYDTVGDTEQTYNENVRNEGFESR